MSTTLNKIIKANDIQTLKKEIEDTSLYTLQKAAYSAIINCRYGCFDIIHNRAKEYLKLNDIANYDYETNYLLKLIEGAAQYNKFDIFKQLLSESKYEDCSIYNYSITLKSYRHKRILIHLLANKTFKKEHIYSIMSSLYSDIETQKDSLKVFLEKNKILMDYIDFDIKEFFDYIKEKSYFSYLGFNRHSIFYGFSFLDFLNKFDKEDYFFRKLPTYEEYFNNKDILNIYKKRYHKAIMIEKIELF